MVASSEEEKNPSPVPPCLTWRIYVPKVVEWFHPDYFSGAGVAAAAIWLGIVSQGRWFLTTRLDGIVLALSCFFFFGGKQPEVIYYWAAFLRRWFWRSAKPFCASSVVSSLGWDHFEWFLVNWEPRGSLGLGIDTWPAYELNDTVVTYQIANLLISAPQSHEFSWISEPLQVIPVNIHQVSRLFQNGSIVHLPQQRLCPFAVPKRVVLSPEYPNDPNPTKPAPGPWRWRPDQNLPDGDEQSN